MQAAVPSCAWSRDTDGRGGWAQATSQDVSTDRDAEAAYTAGQGQAPRLGLVSGLGLWESAPASPGVAPLASPAGGEYLAVLAVPHRKAAQGQPSRSARPSGMDMGRHPCLVPLGLSHCALSFPHPGKAMGECGGQGTVAKEQTWPCPDG